MEVVTTKNSELDKPAIDKEDSLLVISTEAIVAESQAISNRVGVESSL